MCILFELCPGSLYEYLHKHDDPMPEAPAADHPTEPNLPPHGCSPVASTACAPGCNRVGTRVQPHAHQAATVCAPGCNRRGKQGATVCAPGCNRMRTRLAPCVLQAPLLVKLFREVALGIYYLHCFDPPVRRRTPARHNNNAVMLTY